jgi:soluble lytic murein transglycosylase-like protein
MVRIMWRESGGNPRAANYRDANGGSYGLLQLNGAHRWRGESMAAFQQRMWDPVSHLAAAKRLYNGSGFGPWRGCP